MSFYVSSAGTIDTIKQELNRQSETLTGASKDEFEAVKPALETILDQNVGQSGTVRMQLTAAGHASFQDGQKMQGQCTVEIKRL